jgi:orotate phosphoribosyltransferase
LFDFRRVILDHDFAHAAARLFFDRFRTPVQICGIEVAAIPLVSAFVMGSSLYASYSANGFFIRKSRKKDGLARMIEGTIADDVPIVVVDDLMNTGSSLIRQVEVIESLGKKVSAVWTILRFRDESFYEYFHTKGIPIYSLFSLNDFENTLSIKNLIKKSPVAPTTNTFSVLWKHISGKPNYIHVVVKSGIAIDDNSLYFGSDSGVFFCLDRKQVTLGGHLLPVAIMQVKEYSLHRICIIKLFFLVRMTEMYMHSIAKLENVDGLVSRQTG